MSIACYRCPLARRSMAGTDAMALSRETQVAPGGGWSASVTTAKVPLKDRLAFLVGLMLAVFVEATSNTHPMSTADTADTIELRLVHFEEFGCCVVTGPESWINPAVGTHDLLSPGHHLLQAGVI